MNYNPLLLTAQEARKQTDQALAEKAKRDNVVVEDALQACLKAVQSVIGGDQPGYEARVRYSSLSPLDQAQRKQLKSQLRRRGFVVGEHDDEPNRETLLVISWSAEAKPRHLMEGQTSGPPLHRAP